MSVIGIRRIPASMSVVKFLKILGEKVSEKFQLLHYGRARMAFNVSFLKMTSNGNATAMVEHINSQNFGPRCQLSAFMPKPFHFIKFNLSGNHEGTYTKKPFVNSRKFPPIKYVNVGHGGIMREIQMKYAGLNSLKKDLGDRIYRKLMYEIGRVVYERLVKVMVNGMNKIYSVFTLSQGYRKKHPHFGDFQLIISTLHRVQDAEGKPRLHLQESDLLAAPPNAVPAFDNLPIEKVHSVCDKYIESIRAKVVDYAKGLKLEATPDLKPKERDARLKVREQIKKLTPYLHGIVTHVIYKQFIPNDADAHYVLLFGEPNLPPKELTKTWLNKFRVNVVRRDLNMHNLLNVYVPRKGLSALLAADGTILSGSKLTIRSNDTPVVKITVDNYSDIGEQLKNEAVGTGTVPVEHSEGVWSDDW